MTIRIIRTNKSTGEQSTVARFTQAHKREAQLTFRTLSYVAQGTVESNKYYQQFDYHAVGPIY